LWRESWWPAPNVHNQDHNLFLDEIAKGEMDSKAAMIWLLGSNDTF